MQPGAGAVRQAVGFDEFECRLAPGACNLRQPWPGGPVQCKPQVGAGHMVGALGRPSDAQCTRRTASAVRPAARLFHPDPATRAKSGEPDAHGLCLVLAARLRPPGCRDENAPLATPPPRFRIACGGDGQRLAARTWADCKFGPDISRRACLWVLSRRRPRQPENSVGSFFRCWLTSAEENAAWRGVTAPARRCSRSYRARPQLTPRRCGSCGA